MKSPIAAFLLAAATLQSAALSQKPEERLGDLLQVLPLPEPGVPDDGAKPPAAAPSAAPPSGPTTAVVPVDIPAPAPAHAAETQSSIPQGSDDDSQAPEAGTDSAPETTADIQERRRQEINAEEGPTVDRLNAYMAERAAAATRRFEEERAAYERSVADQEELARRRQAEHRAALEEHARRVEREQAEYRARVQACLDGDRTACAPKP